MEPVGFALLTPPYVKRTINFDERVCAAEVCVPTAYRGEGLALRIRRTIICGAQLSLYPRLISFEKRSQPQPQPRKNRFC
jgi:hypothetical protein